MNFGLMLNQTLINIIISIFFQVTNCSKVISYSVNLSNEVMSLTRNFTSEMCSNSQCSLDVDLTEHVTRDVIVNIFADGYLILTTIIRKKV